MESVKLQQESEYTVLLKYKDKSSDIMKLAKANLSKSPSRSLLYPQIEYYTVYPVARNLYRQKSSLQNFPVVIQRHGRGRYCPFIV